MTTANLGMTRRRSIAPLRTRTTLSIDEHEDDHACRPVLKS
jgi:hypothetical protein